MSLFLRESFVGSLDSNADIIDILVEPFFDLSLRGEDKFRVKVVAVNIDRLACIDLSRQQYHSVLEAHG